MWKVPPKVQIPTATAIEYVLVRHSGHSADIYALLADHWLGVSARKRRNRTIYVSIFIRAKSLRRPIPTAVYINSSRRCNRKVTRSLLGARFRFIPRRPDRRFRRRRRRMNALRLLRTPARIYGGFVSISGRFDRRKCRLDGGKNRNVPVRSMCTVLAMKYRRCFSFSTVLIGG